MISKTLLLLLFSALFNACENEYPVVDESPEINCFIKFLGDFERFNKDEACPGTSLMDALDKLHNIEGGCSETNNGFFYATVGDTVVEVVNLVEDYSCDVWSQEIKCARRLRNDVVSEWIGYDKVNYYVCNSYNPCLRAGIYKSGEDDSGNKFRKSAVGTFGRKCINGVWSAWYDCSNHYIDSPNYGKKIALFGGSFAQNMRGGSIIHDNIEYGYDFTYNGVSYSLVDYIAERLGAVKFDDYAVGGCGYYTGVDNTTGGLMFKNNVYNQVVESFRNEPAGYDIYILFGSINDYGRNVCLGECNGAGNDSTFCGGWKKTIDYIRSYAPDARIYTITPFKVYKDFSGNFSDFAWNPHTAIRNSVGCTLFDYIQAQKDVALINSVPCFDLNAVQGFGGANWIEYYIYDGIHPSGKGYYSVADKIVNFLADS